MDLEHLEIGLHFVNVTNRNLVLVGVWDFVEEKILQFFQCAEGMERKTIEH